MNRQVSILVLTLLCSLSTSQAWGSDSAANSKSAQLLSSSDRSENDFEKRQLVPLPRIGRSLMSPKRQSLIPAPRIGRSDPALKQSAKSLNAIDCATNPDLCENTGSSSGLAGANEELVESPIDIQLRAAFIPRLGKRRVYMEEDSRVNEALDKATPQYRKYVLIPGLGYVDVAESINAAAPAEVTDEDSEVSAAQRNSLLRSLLDNAKRAIPYTPRIGRAVFAPRIGKKATFVPRIG